MATMMNNLNPTSIFNMARAGGGNPGDSGMQVTVYKPNTEALMNLTNAIGKGFKLAIGAFSEAKSKYEDGIVDDFMVKYKNWTNTAINGEGGYKTKQLGDARNIVEDYNTQEQKTFDSMLKQYEKQYNTHFNRRQLASLQKQRSVLLTTSTNNLDEYRRGEMAKYTKGQLEANNNASAVMITGDPWNRQLVDSELQNIRNNNAKLMQGASEEAINDANAKAEGKIRMDCLKTMIKGGDQGLRSANMYFKTWGNSFYDHRPEAVQLLQAANQAKMKRDAAEAKKRQQGDAASKAQAKQAQEMTLGMKITEQICGNDDGIYLKDANGNVITTPNGDKLFNTEEVEKRINNAFSPLLSKLQATNPIEYVKQEKNYKLAMKAAKARGFYTDNMVKQQVGFVKEKYSSFGFGDTKTLLSGVDDIIGMNLPKKEAESLINSLCQKYLIGNNAEEADWYKRTGQDKMTIKKTRQLLQEVSDGTLIQKYPTVEAFKDAFKIDDVNDSIFYFAKSLYDYGDRAEIGNPLNIDGLTDAVAPQWEGAKDVDRNNIPGLYAEWANRVARATAKAVNEINTTKGLSSKVPSSLMENQMGQVVYNTTDIPQSSKEAVPGVVYLAKEAQDMKHEIIRKKLLKGDMTQDQLKLLLMKRYGDAISFEDTVVDGHKALRVILNGQKQTGTYKYKDQAPVQEVPQVPVQEVPQTPVQQKQQQGGQPVEAPGDVQELITPTAQ